MSPRAAPLAPPGILRLAGHPVRWRLLRELAHSDRRVAELCSALALPQNLVSYHLSLLRAERVVSRRRSSADGRDGYYALDLGRCRELLSGAAGALHPGLRLAGEAPRLPGAGVRVLFVCTGNSARSRMAEALVRHLAGDAVEACSAGSNPKPLHPNAARVMRQRGIELEGTRSRHLSEFSGERFGYVISLCDRVREVCPEFPGHPDLIHWSVPDPSAAGTSDAQTLAAFEQTAEELATRVAFLLELIRNDELLNRTP